MKPNFEEMSVSELRAYVLSHRDDDEAIRALFHHPSLKYKTMPPLVTPEGVPIEENIRIAEEAIRQRVERANENKKEKEPEMELKLRHKIEKKVEEKLRHKIEKKVEEKLRHKIEKGSES